MRWYVAVVQLPQHRPNDVEAAFNADVTRHATTNNAAMK